ANYPSRDDWRTALVNYVAGSGLDSQGQLDLYRLQAANGAMASERDYQAYATLAEKAGYPAEAKAIIEAGRAAGKLTTKHGPTAQLLKTVTPRATKEIAGLPALAKKAAAGGKGGPAMALADIYFSQGQYPQAVEFYQMALTKGDVDTSRVHARLGIAMARSGDLAAAKQALAQADGNWAAVAGFWSIWVDEKNGRSAALPASSAVTG
ncbi:MAG: tetratricopeptide repeat protein, partial [Sphingobium sp.]